MFWIIVFIIGTWYFGLYLWKRLTIWATREDIKRSLGKNVKPYSRSTWD